MLRCGLLGLPGSGKTTLFKLLTGGRDNGRGVSNAGIAFVPDNRVDALSSVFNPRKTTRAQIEFSDVPSLQISQGAKTHDFLDEVRKADALVYTLNLFGAPFDGRKEPGESGPLSELDQLISELVISDLGLVETRLERLKTSRKKLPEHDREIRTLEILGNHLVEGEPAATAPVSQEEWNALRHMEFLTNKKALVVANLSEDKLGSLEYEGREQLRAWCLKRDFPLVELSAQVEAEIRELSDDERAEFMKSYGIEEPGIVKVARAAYDLLGLISFFTVGEDEVKAWTITRNTTAKAAAGKIHSDIERGFIRAEVVSYNDFMECGASFARCREKGLLRLEGKDYLVSDGDIISFRFNV